MRDKSPEPWMPFFHLIDSRIAYFIMLLVVYGLELCIVYGDPPITTNEGFSLSANSILFALFCFLIIYLFFITIYQIKELKSFVAKPADYPYSSERFNLLYLIEAFAFLFFFLSLIFSLGTFFTKNESLLILILLVIHSIIPEVLMRKVVKESNIRKKIL